MVEMLGVLTVLAILATIIIAATPRQLDLVAANVESTNLVRYATALQSSIFRTRVIPSSNNLAQAIANEMGMDVKDVNVNSRNMPRAFIYDPSLTIGAASVGGQGYTQTILGGGVPALVTGALWVTNPPTNPRLMILSTLGTAGLPSGVTNGISAADFATLWGWADGSVPTNGPWSGWAGQGEDVKIQRVNLSPLFVHLVLYNYNYPSTNRGQYAIDRLATNQIPSNGAFPNTNRVDNYFLKGTLLGLFKSTNLNSTLDAEQILNRDTSFAYVQNVWHSSLNLGAGVGSASARNGNAIWETAALFTGSPYSTTSLNSANVAGGPNHVTPPDVVNDIQNFMLAYLNWSTNGFPAAFSNNVYLTQKQMIDDMNRLCGAAPPNNGATPTVSFTSGYCTNPPTQ
jgi:hypothetical protein